MASALGFLAARPDGEWRVTDKVLTGRCEGAEITGECRWWGGRWTVETAFRFPVPEPVILFVSRWGMEHGFWRDLPVGDLLFDREHFVFSDTPALLPLIVGPATRRAIGDHGRPDALTIYVRNGATRTRGTNDVNDTQAIARHLSVHRALAEDHRVLLERWQQLMTTAHAKGDASWPPSGTLMSRVGTLLVNTAWTRPTTREAQDWEASAGSLRTQITAHNDGKLKSRWSLHEVIGGIATHTFGNRRFMVYGTPTVGLALLGDLLHQGAITQVLASNQVVVSLRGLAGSRQMHAAVELIERSLGAEGSTSPYR